MLNKSLNIIFNESNDLKKIRLIMNELLSNGAYSDKELETQIKKLERQNTPQYEIDIVHKAWSIRKQKAQKLFIKMDKYLNDMDVYYGK